MEKDKSSLASSLSVSLTLRCKVVCSILMDQILPADLILKSKPRFAPCALRALAWLKNAPSR